MSNKELPPSDRDSRVIIHHPRQRPDDEVHSYQKKFRWGLFAAFIAMSAPAIYVVVKGVRQSVSTHNTIGEIFNAVVDWRTEKEKTLKKKLMATLKGQPRVTLPNGVTVYIDARDGNAIYAHLINEGYFYEMYVNEAPPRVWFRLAAEDGKGFPRVQLEDENMDGKDITGRSYADEGQGIALDPQEAALKFDQTLDFFSQKLSQTGL